MEINSGTRDGPVRGRSEPIDDEDSRSNFSRDGSPMGRVDRDIVLDKFLDNVDDVDRECSSIPLSVRFDLINDLSNFLSKIALMRPRPYGGVTR